MSTQTKSHVVLTLSYDGSHYHGFQVQKNALSVCEVLQNALEKLYHARPDVKGCSRTDAGVHAKAYCVSYFQPKEIEVKRLPLAINQFLPQDIRVYEAKTVKQDFHARYSAISKEYLYRVRNSAVDSPFDTAYTWRVPHKLCLASMQQAAKFVEGTHDFRTFMSVGSKIQDTVRTVHFFRVWQEDEIFFFHICADGYLYNMVRILVGTLIEVGIGRIPPHQMQNIITSQTRQNAGDTAPAKGLFLYKVNYAEEEA